jgi:eukaryotic-like serine/threonine-protein kinase
VVVAATHITLGERVALKFLLHEAALHGDSVARFLREARAAARIKCEHIARVFDVGTLEDGAPYYVMEYLEGSDLGARASSDGFDGAKNFGTPAAISWCGPACWYRGGRVGAKPAPA